MFANEPEHVRCSPQQRDAAPDGVGPLNRQFRQ